MDRERSRSARRLREEVGKTWPEVAKRWQVIEGLFPDASEGTSFEGKDTALVFTNVGAKWEDGLLERILGAFSKFEHVLIDLWRFGDRRDNKAERDDLLSRIAAGAKSAQRVQAKGFDNYDFAQFDY